MRTRISIDAFHAVFTIYVIAYRQDVFLRWRSSSLVDVGFVSTWARFERASSFLEALDQAYGWSITVSDGAIVTIS